MKNPQFITQIDVRNLKQMLFGLVATGGPFGVMLIGGCGSSSDPAYAPGSQHRYAMDLKKDLTDAHKNQWARHQQRTTQTIDLPGQGTRQHRQPTADEQLVQAIQNRDLDLVIQAIRTGELHLDQKRIGSTAVNVAAAHGTDEILSYVLAAGAIEFVNTTGFGSSPLENSLRYNSRPKVVARLIRAGADVRGDDAMFIAASHQSNPAVLEVLFLEGSADVNAKNKAGLTPLMYASFMNPNPAICVALLRAGADVDATDGDGKTALMHAGNNPLFKRNPRVIKALLEAGADPNAKSNKGMTALDYALANKKTDPQSLEMLKAVMNQ